MRRVGNGVVARNQGYAYGGMKEAFRLNSYAGLTYREGVNVTVTTADVTGSTGIYALSGATNNGSGIQYYGSYLRTPTRSLRLTIDTTGGGVVCTAGGGIQAIQSVASGGSVVGVKITMADVIGTSFGIHAVNSGSVFNTRAYNLVDTRLGTVTASAGSGIVIEQSVGARCSGCSCGSSGVAVRTADVLAYGDNGETTFVSGNSGHGIQVLSQADFETNINVTSATYVTGGLSGITASQIGNVFLGFNINIDNGGVVANRSFLSSDLTINADNTGAGVTLNIGATGIVIGTVDLTDADDVFTNDGHWDASGGTSDFGLGDDQFFNASDLTLVVGNGTAGQMTRFDGLESFTNTGTIDFADGYASDTFVASGGHRRRYHGDGRILGLSVEREWDGAGGGKNALWASVNILHDFDGRTGVAVAAPNMIAMGRTAEATRVELGLGGRFYFGQGTAFGTLGASLAVGGGDDGLDLRATIGVNFTW